MTKEKIHWLHNPNKAFLGHQDLPNGEDVILTIASAEWEAVENPKLNTTKEERVIRFVENYKWIKPFICNITNAKMIMKVTGDKYIEDSIGKKLKIGISQTKVKREEVDCLRIREIFQKDLTNYINKDQINNLKQLCVEAKKNESEIFSILKIKDFSFLPESKFQSVEKRLLTIIKQLKNENN